MRGRSVGLREVEKVVACRYCGESGLGWVQSKAGRWYLAPVLKDSSNDALYAQVFKPHRCVAPPAGGPRA